MCISQLVLFLSIILGFIFIPFLVGKYLSNTEESRIEVWTNGAIFLLVILVFIGPAFIILWVLWILCGAMC